MKARFVLPLLLFTACRDVVPPSEVEAAPARQPLAGLEAQREKLAAMRAPLPDARFVAAVAAMHHFVTGWTIVAPDLEREAGGTRIRYYGRDVGVLRDGASFTDAVALLAAWPAKMGKPWTLPDTGPAADSDLLLDDDALDALGRVQSEWATAPSRRGLHDAARALLGLSLGTCDDLGFADDLSGRALAAVVLDRLHGREVTRELALLADRFAYPADADAFARKLPEDDAVRAFVTGDDGRLAQSPGSLARFLEVERLARKRDLDGAAALSRRLLARHALGASLLSVRLCGGDERVAQPLFARALLDAAIDAGTTVATKAKADLDALAITPGADHGRAASIVYGWLAIQRVEGWPRFEGELERVGAHDRGPFFDRSSRQALLRTRALDAIHRTALRLARELSPSEAEKAFAIEVPPVAATELGKATRSWFHALVDARRALPGLVAPTGPLGPVATVDVVETALSGLATEVPDDEWDARAPAKWALARLDARRTHRQLAALLGEHVLFDPALVKSARAISQSLAGARPDRAPGITRPPPQTLAALDEAVARELHAPSVEAIAAVARFDPAAIARLEPTRPRAIGALIGATLAVTVRDHAAATELARALEKAGVEASVRRAIALGALDHDGAVLAAALLQPLASEPATPLATIERIEEAARAIAAAHGETAASGFRAAHPLGDALAFAAPIFYEHDRPILLAPAPRETRDLSTLLSLATPAILRDPAKLSAARAQIGDGSTRFSAIARHLVGLDDLATVLARPTSAAERCELAFYLAIAAEAAGRSADADVWLSASLDEGGPTVAEWRWAMRHARGRMR